MSLVATAVRLTLCEALKAKTLAGLRVYDSNIGPLDDFFKKGDASSPVITVATDDQTATFDAMSYTTASRELAVVIEMAIAQPVDVAVGGDVTVTVPHTDRGLELSLDVMSRQIMAVLQADRGTWAELFKAFAGKPTKLTSKRGAGWEHGERFAARQIVITFDPVHEPIFGQAPAETFWADLVTALRTVDAESSAIADLIEKAVVCVEVPTWARLQADLGLTTAAMEAVGLGPYLPGEAPATANVVTSDGDHLEVTAEDEDS